MYLKLDNFFISLFNIQINVTRLTYLVKVNKKKDVLEQKKPNAFYYIKST